MAAIDEVQEALEAGRIEDAVLITNREIDAWQVAFRSQRLGKEQLLMASAVAEVLIYRGRNGDATAWLAPWVNTNGELPMTAPPRAQLQAAELLYGQRRFEEAAA